MLDFDATDDPLHGNQQGAYFHGYYGHYCYLPLYCFCGDLPLLAQLRDCKRDASFEGLKAQLKEGKLQSPCRTFTDFEYATRETWSRARRVIGKAEVLAEGDNPRFIVTNLPQEGWGQAAQAARFAPAALYEKLARAGTWKTALKSSSWVGAEPPGKRKLDRPLRKMPAPAANRCARDTPTAKAGVSRFIGGHNCTFSPTASSRPLSCL